jgi:hypothetical protein
VLLYRLPIACWRTDERVDSRVLARLCLSVRLARSARDLVDGVSPANLLGLCVAPGFGVRSSALLAPLRYCFLVPGAGRSTRVSHIALALLDALVSSIAFSCLLRSLRALILLCPSATPQFSPRASRLPGAAARRCVARRQAGAPRSQRGRSRRRRRGRPGRRSWGPYKHTLVSITFRGYRVRRTRSRTGYGRACIGGVA